MIFRHIFLLNYLIILYAKILHAMPEVPCASTRQAWPNHIQLELIPQNGFLVAMMDSAVPDGASVQSDGCHGPMCRKGPYSNPPNGQNPKN